MKKTLFQKIRDLRSKPPYWFWVTFMLDFDVAFPQERSPNSSEREVHGHSGFCGTSVLCVCRHLVPTVVLEGNFYVVSNKPLCRSPCLSCREHTPANASSLEHRTHRTALALACLWLCSPCACTHLFPFSGLKLFGEGSYFIFLYIHC